jgi:hypothetical protein
MKTIHGPYDGWTPDARAFLDDAIERHGGWTAWDNLGPLRLQLVGLSGLIRWVKGVDRVSAMPRVFVVDPKAQRTEFPDFPRPGLTTVYEGGHLLTRDRSGRTIEDRARYRAKFDSPLARMQRWSELDVAYFVGYSQANYHSYPFVLPALNLVKYRRESRSRTMWHVLTLEYPSGYESHNRRQTFRFDATGLLRRVDYRAEVTGPGPTAAAHYEDYAAIGGVMYPRRRRVFGKVAGVVTGLNILSLDVTIAPAVPAARAPGPGVGSSVGRGH